MRTNSVAGRLAAAALDLVVPPVCVACRGDGLDGAGGGGPGPHGLCGRCARLVHRVPAAPCPRCAAALGPGVEAADCAACARLRPRFSAACAAARYAGFVGELVRRAKYGRDPLLATPLAALLVEAVEVWPAREGADAVVPVPTTATRRGERGFHLADLLASAVARRLRVPLRERWLVRVGDPVPQASLPRSERLLAARGTVEVRRPPHPWLRRIAAPDVEGLRVLLVDDVMTTGATANESARVLLAAGAAEVRVAVAARA